MSSEKSLAQKIIGEGGEWTGGMAVRFPDVDCSDVDVNVLRETLNKIDGIYRNYGVAIGPFAQAFMDGSWFDKPDELRAKIFNAADAIAGADADGARRRAALPFALIGVCGTLALKGDITAVRATLELATTQLEVRIDRVVIRLGSLMVVLAGFVFAALHYWPPRP